MCSSRFRARQVRSIGAILINVEVDYGGISERDTVSLPDTEVRESRDHLRRHQEFRLGEKVNAIAQMTARQIHTHDGPPAKPSGCSSVPSNTRDRLPALTTACARSPAIADLE